jgi:hypothetical protein
MEPKQGDNCQQEQMHLANKAKAEHELLLRADIFHGIK